jgi:thiamine kinase-like enzyme
LEVQALAFLGKIDFTAFATPVLKDYSLSKHAWYVREYIEGDILGDAHLVKSTPTLIEYHQQIMNILEELASQKTTFNSTVIDLRTYYQAKIDQLGDFLNDIFPDFKKKLIKKLGQIKDIELPKCLVHGDFHYGNIFFVRNQKPYLTDWEFIHDGYIGEDIAQYVAIMWQHPTLQAEVLDNFRKKFNLIPEESPSFSFFQFYQNIKECQHWYYYYKYSENMNKYPRDYVEKALKYFKEKIQQQLSE